MPIQPSLCCFMFAIAVFSGMRFIEMALGSRRHILRPVARFDDQLQLAEESRSVRAVDCAMIEALRKHADRPYRNAVAFGRFDDERLLAHAVCRQYRDLPLNDDLG